MRRILCVLALLAIGSIDAQALTLTAPAAAWSDVALWLSLAVFGVTLGTTALTMADHAKRRDPDDGIARIIELLTQHNQILEDMPFMEGNLVTGHLTTVRTQLPDVFWRMMNQGVLPSKSTTTQITEQTGSLEAYSQLDQGIAELGGDLNALRLSEARPFIEAMNIEMAQTLFYGSASAPQEFIGLSPRYSQLTGMGNSDNIINAGGAGSTNTSIWLIAWGAETITGIYPKGSTVGLSHDDLGLETVENAGGVAGALMRAYRDHWVWKAGIAVIDYRHAVRIANIDVPTLVNPSDRADLIELMADAEERLPDELGRRAFYVNRTIRRQLRHATREAVGAGGGITFDNVAGKRVMFFGETPVRRTDALVNTEARVL